ncbi:glycosyltransferase family 4 protein [Mucilaginibacter auburnensis]|uniref:Glycosyl transferase family 1 n=1 Tax=Mucilaginibacter auburnensis TaxID=1457233 RepID=A0A2H9VW54_9SPHI|nr:glycosyltransferase family 4 protein [Mucilaginibacter auburnensis]PJJ85046.1 glycosyl transferase family 1 [Mucilaginibacter auburnensis]
MKIFTWHIHGSYLYYLSQGNYEIYIPTRPDKAEGYYGRGETFPFGNNVIEIPADEVSLHEFDCILFQTNQNYLTDQFEILSEKQRALPKIYLEHDPPRSHPTDTLHIINAPDIKVVHVTHFNKLMWNNGNADTKVIIHGVTDPQIAYTGELAKGIVVINNLPTRGRLLGADVFQEVSKHVPLDLVGMGTGDWGLGEVLHPQLPAFQSRYRFFFNPIRYTSLGLAVCEAMMMGIPVVALATTEIAAIIDNGYSGFIDTDIDVLVRRMKMLIDDPQLAFEIGQNARTVALNRFNIQRFTQEWEQTFIEVCEKKMLTINLN